MTSKSVKQVATTTELASDTAKVAKADDGVQAGKNGSAEGNANPSISTADKTVESSKADQNGRLALDLQYFSSKTDTKTISDSVINAKTSPQLKTLLKEKGVDDVYFQSLLHPERTLNSSETALVNQVREELSTVASGTMMQKVIPQQDIYQYLYNPKYEGTRGFVTTKEHAEGLVSLEDIYYGLRLDYNQTAFKVNSGMIDPTSSRVGDKDQFYGVFQYKADSEKLSTPSDLPTPENFPYTGKGFSGSKTDIIPEFYQNAKAFEDGDMFQIRDRNGKVQSTLLFDEEKKGWILVE